MTTMNTRPKPCGYSHPLPCGLDVDCGGCPECGGDLDTQTIETHDDAGVPVSDERVRCLDCSFTASGGRFYSLGDI